MNGSELIDRFSEGASTDRTVAFSAVETVRDRIVSTVELRVAPNPRARVDKTVAESTKADKASAARKR